MATEFRDEMKAKVESRLKDGPYACTSLEKLSGGTANFVYRGTLATPLSDGTKTVVIKHTEGYVAQSPGFKLTTTRCDYEQTILTALSTFPPIKHTNITIQTPTMHLFSASTNTQVYSDLPSSLDLKTYVLTYSSTLILPQCRRLGHALGLWTRNFHSWAQADEQKELVESMKGNVAMRDLKFMINYEALVGIVARFPGALKGCVEIFEKVREERRGEIGGDEAVLIHGDFWSGNVLLPNGPIPDSTDPMTVFIIDWELSQVSSPAFDLGQMFAELFELKHFKNIDAGIWLIEAFMQGYGNIDEKMAFKTAIHVGTHLLCFGSVVQGWGTDEQVEDVVRVGGEWIVKGWEGDRKFFEGGPLGSLFH
ncbi:kinase-like domain-containing protein [Rhexocercosporidium sp. MPI-PUGE-AT-0058]|nr:kinase-like domain-containing protein [Rhexocercosporidium sp. MPI-PUGE-AT-0058]